FHLYAAPRLQRYRSKIQYRLDSCRCDLIQNLLSRPRRNSNYHHINRFRSNYLSNLLDVANWYLPFTDSFPDLLAVVIEERYNSEIRPTKPVILSQGSY